MKKIEIILGITLFWMTCLTLFVIHYLNEDPGEIYQNVIVNIYIDQSIENDIEEEDEFFYTTTPIKLPEEDLYCLQRNVFFEAGIEPYEGKIAVAQVTLNRLEARRWGQSVCDVVFAHAQFSWTLWQSKRNKTPSGPLWEETKQAVKDFKRGKRIKNLDASLHYHADYIKEPFWADVERQIIKIGRHIFYEG